MKFVFMLDLMESDSTTLPGTIFWTNRELVWFFIYFYNIYLPKNLYIIYTLVICICLFNTWQQGDISSWSDRNMVRTAQEYSALSLHSVRAYATIMFNLFFFFYLEVVCKDFAPISSDYGFLYNSLELITIYN